MTTASKPPINRGPWYWQTFTPGEAYVGRDLAALRKGVGRRVGDVPEMWPFYKSIVSSNRPVHENPRIEAEHAALTLFAVHQQSRPHSMHRDKTGLGTAARQLRRSGKFSEEAIDRRMNEIATATSVNELVVHLRGLVNLLRAAGFAMDYSQLRQDIERWHYPDARSQIRARWGSDYFLWRGTPESQQNREQQADSEE